MFFIRDFKGNLILGILLVSVSISIYLTQIFLFNDTKTTIFYFFQDMAFVPLQVLLVTLILDGILSKREKKLKVKRVNLLVNAFYVELGIELIKNLSVFILNFEDLKSEINQKVDWKKIKKHKIQKEFVKFQYKVDSRKGNLELLKSYLMNKKSFLLSLFENPNLMEHDVFTDMLWAIYHIADELNNREDLRDLPEKDMQHLSGDIERAFKLLVSEWTYYMDHLNKEYPYLYSLAVRRNPFSENEIRIQ